jgi:hypothetical protein
VLAPSPATGRPAMSEIGNGALYMLAWIRWPDGYWHCRHCHREVGTGHPPECPIARLDFVAHD